MKTSENIFGCEPCSGVYEKKMYDFRTKTDHTRKMTILVKRKPSEHDPEKFFVDTFYTAKSATLQCAVERKSNTAPRKKLCPELPHTGRTIQKIRAPPHELFSESDTPSRLHESLRGLSCPWILYCPQQTVGQEFRGGLISRFGGGRPGQTSPQRSPATSGETCVIRPLPNQQTTIDFIRTSAKLKGSECI